MIIELSEILEQIVHFQNRDNIDWIMSKHQDFKTKRQQFTYEVRRKLREDVFVKKRNMGSTNTIIKQKNQSTTKEKSSQRKLHVIDSRFQGQIKKLHQMDLSKEDIFQFFQKIHDPDPLAKHYGVIGIRQLLCVKENPPIQAVIDTGVVPLLIQFANQTQYPQLQLQATWCIANISAGDTTQCNSVIEKGAIQVLVNQLDSQHIGIVQQAIWALGNIACDLPAHRSSILKNGGLKNLIKVIQINQSLIEQNPGLQQIIQSASWTLSNLLRKQPLIEYHIIREAIPVFHRVLIKGYIKQLDIIANICWAISFYTNKKPQKKKVDKLQECIDSGVLQKLIQFIQMDDDTLTVACLRILGTVASGTESQTRYVIGLGILNYMQPFILRKKKKTIRREACWLLSNITASSQQCISTVVTNNSLVQYILTMFQSDLPDIKIQICFILTNVVEFGDPEAVYMFFKNIDIMKYYIQIIKNESDVSLLETALETLYYIMKIGEKFKEFEKDIKCNNFFLYKIYQGGIVEKLESLQHHDQDKIYRAVNVIFENFFSILNALDEQSFV